MGFIKGVQRMALLIATFSPRIRSVPPSVQMWDFQFLAEKVKHKFLWEF